MSEKKLATGSANRKVKWIGVNLLLLLSASLATAQLPTATISGVVRDPSRALIPGTTVTATNTETGLSRSATTGANGAYRFPALPVGRYDVRAEHSGFQTKIQTGLRITVGEEAVLNFTLEIGTVAESISVTAEAPVVNTTSGSLGGLVSERRVSDLPLNGRNLTDLAFLQTGVQEQRTAGNDSRGGVAFSSQGAPIRSNLFMIDGTIMNNPLNRGIASANETSMGVEGIKEFRVVTNSFSAEYGMNMGSQITIVTKSGTNQIHGSVFEFLRNSALDARNWNDGAEKPPFRRNNFGGAVGGPIVRDRTFYFLTYEGLRQSRPRTELGSVPTAAARTGDLDGDGVPEVTVDPVVVPYLKLYPLPNGEDLGGGVGRFTLPLSNVQRQDYGQGRLDYNFSDADSLFGRYTIDDALATGPTLNPDVAENPTSRNKYITISENHILSPEILNTFRASFSRVRTLIVNEGVRVPGLEFVPGQVVGSIPIGGVNYPTGTGSQDQGWNQRITSFSDDVFYTRGNHSFKFGMLLNLYRQKLISGAGGSTGRFRFSSLRSFLQASPRDLRILTPGSITDRIYDFSMWGFYLQDDLRATSNLTLNLGLRYEFITELEEQQGAGASLRDWQRDPAVTLGAPFKNPSLRNFGPRLGFAWDPRGDGRTALRGGFGILFDLHTTSTSLRNQGPASPPLSSRTNITPRDFPGLKFGPLPTFPLELAGKDLGTSDYNMQQPHLLSYNLTLDRQLPFDVGLSVSYAGSRGLNLIRRHEGNPRFPSGTPQNGVCVRRPASEAFDPGGPKCWLKGDPRINPNWTSIEAISASGNSWYSAMQVAVNRRLGRGFEFQSSYTWSHALDDVQGQSGSDDPNASRPEGDDPFNRLHDKGSAGFDVRHNWKFNTTYRFPFNIPGGWGKVANGWWIGTIISWNSGFPISPASEELRAISGNLGDEGMRRLDLVPGVKHEDITRGVSRGCEGVPAGTPVGTAKLFFDPCAFAIPALGLLGNAGRSSIWGPNFNVFDFSIAKDTPLPFMGEQGALQFRVEIFNLFNHPSLGIPNRFVYAGEDDVEEPLPDGGRITDTLSRSRQVQFALKILF